MIKYCARMSAPEFTLKTTPPRLPRTALDRGRLMQIWSLVYERTAIAIIAPAGFGKTTLLLQWRRRWMEQDALVAWLGADAQDQPTRFVTALLQSIRRASGRKVFDIIAAQYASKAGQEIEALTALLAEIALLGNETVLMIDDAERLPEATVHASIQYLLLNAPANLHVVIGSRVPLPMQTSELVAKNGFAVLRTDDLRLRFEESIEIIERRLGPRLHLDQRAKLHDLTEGWPVGLQLAIAKVEEEDDPSTSIATLSARREGLRDYFVASLLSRLPSPQRDFLVRTAILDHMNAELCEAVTNCADASARLEQLTLETPIMMVGETRDWVRLHPLARDFLLGRFEQLPRTEQAELHIRASRWLAEHDRFHEAARHALAADDEALAHDYAARSLWALGTQGKLTEAREWLDRIPPYLLAGNASLRLVAAWVIALGDGNAEALRIGLEVADDPASSPQMLKMALRVVGGAAAYADRLGVIADVQARWPQQSSPDEDPLYAVAPLNVQALMALHTGSTTEVRSATTQIAAYGNAGSLRLAAALAQGMAALSHLRDGNANQAEAMLRPALALAEKEDGRRSTVACLYAAVLAAALQERGQLAAAQALLANRLDVIESGFPDPLLAAYRTLARIALSHGDEQRALSTLDNLDALAKHRNLPRLHLHSLAERIRIHALAHRTETMDGLVHALDRLEAAFQAEELRPFLLPYQLAAMIAKTYAALAHQDLDGVERQLEAADRLARQLQRTRDGWTIKVLHAIADRQRHADTALASLSEVVGLADLGGNTTLLADTHPLALRMAMELHETTTGLRMAQGPAPANEPSVPVAALPDSANSYRGLLTAKESEVLRLLQKGMSNKLIARDLDISAETVKWHLKNLFMKLSAGTRRHAVDRALLLGLIGD
jgi:LuxR family transcriptional regulator, maltose regulon positive regulatory protein